MSKEDNISKVVTFLRKCKSILFITGAGISAESGLPTYRGIGGLYNKEVTEDGIPIEVALSGDTLETQPEITWKYLSSIEEKCRGATFNRAHEIIVEIEKVFERVWVLTQNIDGFHFSAGSRNVIDIHGDYHNLICPYCHWRKTVVNYKEMSIPPFCPECKKIVRPDVVFFGEMLPIEKTDILLRELRRGFDIYFSIGTTSVFPYISQPIFEAQQLNKLTVEINPGQTQISSAVDIKIAAEAVSTLENIWHEYNLQNRINCNRK